MTFDDDCTPLLINEDQKSVCCHNNPSAKPDKKSPKSRRKLALALLCLGFALGEYLGGWMCQSFAVYSVAMNTLNKSLKYFNDEALIWMSRKQPSKRYNFGYQRTEALLQLFLAIPIWNMAIVLIYR